MIFLTSVFGPVIAPELVAAIWVVDHLPGIGVAVLAAAVLVIAIRRRRA